MKSKVIISLFETVRFSVSISPRNLYNSLKRNNGKQVFALNAIVKKLRTCISIGVNQIFIQQIGGKLHFHLKTNILIYKVS